MYNKLIEFFESEFNILLNVPKEKLQTVIDIELAEIILRNRNGEIVVNPGYDGKYGEVSL